MGFNPRLPSFAAALNNISDFYDHRFFDRRDFSSLVRQVQAYSRDVLAAMRDGGASPDIVQIGNEIPDGMLWPDGKISGNPAGFADLAALLRADIDGVRAGAGGGGHSRAPDHDSH